MEIRFATRRSISTVWSNKYRNPMDPLLIAYLTGIGIVLMSLAVSALARKQEGR